MRIRRDYIYSLDEVPLVVDIPYFADLFKINAQTVRRYCRSGQIRASKFGKDWRIPKSVVERFCRGGEIIV